ncbi:MAG: hypothetical protein BroJett002_37250 [Candidatus Brocadia sinica]|nr:MAG: hypothetical protein BroJett002_37250 [Candidatus Brocadia sinica]
MTEQVEQERIREEAQRKAEAEVREKARKEQEALLARAAAAKTEANDEVRLLDEEIKGIQGEIKSLEVMYEIHSLQQTLDKYDEIPVSDVILSATEEKLLSKLKELSSPLLNFPTVCDQLEEYNRELGILARSREDKLNKIILNETTTN